MTQERPKRPPLAERLKKGLTELIEHTEGTISLRTTFVSADGKQAAYTASQPHPQEEPIRE